MALPCPHKKCDSDLQQQHEMASITLPTVMVQTSHHYQAQLSGAVTIGEIAQYLSQHEARIETSTLERARPVGFDQRLRDLDIQAGDRLVIFMQNPKTVDLPAPLRPGDKILRFRLGDFELNSRGKKALLVGKPDEAQHTIPDIDLRHFIPPKHLEFISRSCLWLAFDDYTRVWYASRVGQTRVMIDELELGADRVALNQEQSVRFYRAADDPAHPASRPLGEIRVIMESVHSRDDIRQIAPGTIPVNLRVGLEGEAETVKASPSVSLEQVATSLILHHRAPLTSDVRLYVMRLVSPQIGVESLNLGPDEFLYAPLSLHYARNLLLLRDIHNRERVYVLAAGQADDEKVIGCRAQAETPAADLDIDLYDSIAGQDYDPRPFYALSPYYARALYKAAEHSWWIRLEERAHVPVFVNNTRLTSSAPVQLSSGDVLTVGPNISDYYARLEVEIASRPD